MPWRRWSIACFSASAALVFPLLTTEPAGAFCPMRTCVPIECGPDSGLRCQNRSCGRDAKGCVAEGAPVYYALPCLSFAVAGGSAARSGLSDQRFLRIVEQAFERWSSVECPGGGSPGLVVSSAGIVDTLGAHFCDAAPEVNLGVWSFPERWPHPPSSVGFTTTRLARDGRILDADVELNRDWLSGRADELTEVLLTVATHEAGHVLGIDHSEDSTALMAESYADGLLTSRGLGPDDVDAICALFPPARTAVECPVPVVRDEALDPVACGHLTEESGCALVAPGRRSSVSGLALFALVLALWVRVRRRAV